MTVRPFLQVPPFPGSTATGFAERRSLELSSLSDEDVDSLINMTCIARVGGAYWGRRPALPTEPYVLIRVRDADERARRIQNLGTNRKTLVWTHSADGQSSSEAEADHLVEGLCDLWHLVSGASAAIVDADDELALIAALADVPVECVGSGPYSDLYGSPQLSTARATFRRCVLGAFAYFDPFSGEPISFEAALEYCSFWRNLIDSNRDIAGAAGFAFWKRPAVDALLWGGADGGPFGRSLGSARRGEAIAIWRARAPSTALAQLESQGAHLVEVEDGFIRSAGLGADCVPPLSIVVDRLGPHFDPAHPSELEQILEHGAFSAGLVERARELRQLILEAGVSKYETRRRSLDRRAANKLHVLVTGQVEDDRAVICGGGGLTSNLELLRRVRAERPDAFIMYKPHPDVEAGHRRGSVPNRLCLTIADEIITNEPISALLELADEVHVNSSLAGFEALMRGKPVTTYGVPFYAGWGLTRDLGPVPARRTSRRTLDELVAAVLLLYPRYLDPVTGLPCPAEVLVRRLAGPRAQAQHRDSIIVRARKFQGQCRLGLAALLGRR